MNKNEFIEVFKTTVNDLGQAFHLSNLIHSLFQNYEVTFDLEDCDRILRITCATETIQSSSIIHLLKNLGWHAEVLPDEIVPASLHQQSDLLQF